MEQTTKDEAIETLVFLSKQQVLKKIPITAPKTVWVAAEVDEWMQARPQREYKPITTGDDHGASK